MAGIEDVALPQRGLTAVARSGNNQWRAVSGGGHANWRHQRYPRPRANTLAAVRLLESLEVEQVLHCGDIGTPRFPSCSPAWPTHFVFGNCDHEPDELRGSDRRGGTHLPRPLWRNRAGRPQDRHHPQRRRPAVPRDDRQRQLSTWSATATRTRPNRTAKAARSCSIPARSTGPTPHTLAVVDLKTMEAEIVPL